MSEERITIKIPEGQLLADAEVFLHDHGWTFQGCTEVHTSLIASP